MHKNVLVCVTQQKTCENLIRAGSRISSEDEDSNLYVIHVVNEKDKLLYNLSDGDALEYLFKITKEVGADLIVKRSKDVIKSIVEFAEEKEITHIVLGSSQDSSKNFVGKLQKKLPGREFII
ncbi:MAG: universal stress protein [Tissierellia bacterium]|nr:universal stress protein [Tissierellia bacterium]MDD4780314.1 universal stress protein [Tissierellia bacterium]